MTINAEVAGHAITPPGPETALRGSDAQFDAETKAPSATHDDAVVRTACIALVLCPQHGDCAGDGRAARVFDCRDGCGFQGCADCMEVHESEPHGSDFGTMSELVRNVGGVV